MEIIRYPHKDPLVSDQNAVTIGNFDGVHKGHQQLIKQVVIRAQENDSQSVVVTMQPLPMQFFKGKPAVDVITPFKFKARLLAELGVDVMCVLNFNFYMAAMSAKSFLQQVLFDGLRPGYVLVGDDFRFGAGRSGNAQMLRMFCQQADVVFEQSHSVLVDNERVSSSLIRSALCVGDFRLVQRLLGRPFMMMGRVAHGQKIGRTLGYPTLNIHIKSGGNALHGIYVVKVKIQNCWHQGVASIGHNPTIRHQAKKLEVHVFDFDQEVYGESVEVLFYQKLRNEVEFGSLTALKAAIAQDVVDAKRYFENNKGDWV